MVLVPQSTDKTLLSALKCASRNVGLIRSFNLWEMTFTVGPDIKASQFPSPIRTCYTYPVDDGAAPTRGDLHFKR